MMDAGTTQTFLLSILFLSLFMPDAWVLGNPPDQMDERLYSVLLSIFIIFILETLILTVVQAQYFLSFFFWMDVIGTLSMILDIGWISDTFMPSGSNKGGGSYLRAARAAKLGARFGRLMRLLKFMKFFRYLPCFKTNVDDEKEPALSAVRKVSVELTGVLSRRVAALVLLIVIVVPFMAYVITDYSPDAWLSNLQYLASTKSNLRREEQFLQICDRFNTFYFPKEYTLMDLRVKSPILFKGIEKYLKFNTSTTWVRSGNTVPYYTEFLVGNITGYIQANVDTTVPNQWDSFFGIMLTILVIIVLIGFSASFSTVIEKLIVMPLEKMISTLRASASAMLQSLKAYDAERRKEDDALEEIDEEDLDGELETVQLENMIARCEIYFT